VSWALQSDWRRKLLGCMADCFAAVARRGVAPSTSDDAVRSALSRSAR
jgi:hypothetical protein